VLSRQVRVVFTGYLDCLKQAQAERVEAQQRERLMLDELECLRERPDRGSELQELVAMVRTYEEQMKAMNSQLEDRCLRAEAALADEIDRACEERQSVRDSMEYLILAKEELEKEVEQLVKTVIAG